MPDTFSPPYVVLMPVYNDWTSAVELLRRLDRVVADHLDGPITVVMMDDGSSQEPMGDTDPLEGVYRSIRQIDIVRLRCNLGHQRAIAVGICHIEKHLPHAGVVVMDSDGEDDPADIPKLIAEFEQRSGSAVVLAKRSERTEGPVFVACYWAYRKLFRVLTGFKVRSGNYCLIGPRHVRSLIAGSDLWNHFGATVFRMRLDTVSLPTKRRPRIDGESKVGLTGLIVHGLSAVSVFLDRGCVRVMFGSAAVVCLGVIALILGWLTSGDHGLRLVFWLAMLAILVGAQVFIGAAVLLFISLRLRDSASVVPARDYGFFIDTVRNQVFSQAGQDTPAQAEQPA
ncbi:MAG: glycosyltransferase [Planctomycetota bacterium]